MMAYSCRWSFISLVLLWNFLSLPLSLKYNFQLTNHFQVEFDEAAAAKITNENGEISKPDFMKFGTDTKLLDFDGGGHATKKSSEPKRKTTQQTKSNNGKVRNFVSNYNQTCKTLIKNTYVSLIWVNFMVCSI